LGEHRQRGFQELCEQRAQVADVQQQQQEADQQAGRQADREQVQRRRRAAKRRPVNDKYAAEITAMYE
jgi:hypothetical protein